MDFAREVGRRLGNCAKRLQRFDRMGRRGSFETVVMTETAAALQARSAIQAVPENAGLRAQRPGAFRIG